jgi:hypothetical protein
MRQPLEPNQHECAHCGRGFYKGRDDHRFCSIVCNRAYHVAERRAAVALYRETLLRGDHLDLEAAQ